jgi:hypothetical protein
MAKENSQSKEHKEFRKWAANKIRGKQRKQILELVDWAWEDPHRTKPRAMLKFIRSQGDFHNLPNAVQSMVPKDRVKGDKMHSCRGCGTRHRDSYRFSPSRSKDSSEDFFIGVNCAQKYFVSNGLNAGLLKNTDELRTKSNSTSDNVYAASAITRSDSVSLLFNYSNKAEESPEGFFQNQVNWLHNHLRTKENPSLEQAVKNAKDPLIKTTRKERQRILDAVSQLRKFPAKMFTPVADDLEAMGETDAAKKLRNYTSRKDTALTNAKVNEILDDIDYISFRKETNSERIGHYPESLTELVNTASRAYEHDKPKWAEDLKTRLKQDNKVLSDSDYRTAKKMVQRWMFGTPQQLDTQSKQQRVRNLATKMESTKDFAKILQDLVSTKRKLDYDSTGGFQEDVLPVEDVEVSIDDLVTEVGSAYTFHKITHAGQEVLNSVEDTTKYGLVKTEDLKKLQRAQKQVDGYVRKEDLSDARLNAVAAVTYLAQTGLVSRIDGLPNYESISTASSFSKPALEKIRQKATAVKSTKVMLERTLNSIPEGKTLDEVRAYVQEKATEGYQTLSGHHFETSSMNFWLKEVNAEEAEHHMDGIVHYHNPSSIVSQYKQLQGESLAESDFAEKWAELKQAKAEGVLYNVRERRSKRYGVWRTERSQVHLLNDRMEEKIDNLLSQPYAVRERIIISPQVKQSVDKIVSSLPERYERAGKSI